MSTYHIYQNLLAQVERVLSLNEERIEYLTDRAMGQRIVIDRLQEQAEDLGRLKQYFGEERVQSIVEQSKALERAEKAAKRSRRLHEMTR